MSLKMLTITPEKGTAFQVEYNPEKYTAARSVQFAEIAIPGLDAPVVQFVRGQSEKITLELFFDTTDQGMVDPVTDVRTLTSQVYGLMEVRSDTHAPPRLNLSWGQGGKLFNSMRTGSPWCVLESASQEFTLFSPGGVPLRAKMNVSFRDAWTIDQQLAQTPRQSSDRTKVVQLKKNQTLSQIAWEQYTDPTQWRPIADANNLANPRFLTPGQALAVPSLNPSQS